MPDGGTTSDEFLRVAPAEQAAETPIADGVVVPDYLEKTYWWAYVRPWAIRIFEREWLINLILWGWYRPLAQAAFAALGQTLTGRTLQMACAYGQFTPRLASLVAKAGGTLDVLDVVQAQLDNLARKLPVRHVARLLHRDSSDTRLPPASYDRVVIFFLMHEQPDAVRQRTLDEAFRVVKPGGRVLIVEFAKPVWWHPLRYLYLPLLRFLEPFAPDIWGHDAAHWLGAERAARIVSRRGLFGNYYQVLTIKG